MGATAMSCLRRLVVVSSALLALSAAPALAARPSGYPTTLSTAHFVVHYTTDPDPSVKEHITGTMAGDVAALAERAYSLEVGSWGYPAPLDDGDGRSDIYVVDLNSAVTHTSGAAIPDAAGPTSSGYILLDYSAGQNQHTVAHELFHLIQFGIWIPDDTWLLEATAEWAGFRADGIPPAAATAVGPYDMALDCLDRIVPNGSRCSYDSYEGGGYSRWSFFELAAERYGVGFVKDVLQRGAASGSSATSALQMISDQLAAKGSSLDGFYTDWTVANMTGAYTAPALQALSAPVYSTPILTGSTTSLQKDPRPDAPVVTSGPIPPITVTADHLSTRYVELLRGDGTTGGPCYAATLALDVKIGRAHV